MYFHAGLRR